MSVGHDRHRVRESGLAMFSVAVSFPAERMIEFRGSSDRSRRRSWNAPATELFTGFFGLRLPVIAATELSA